MNSLQKSPDAPIAAYDGLETPVQFDGDPYLALDDLMAAVEALCPVWPQREIFVDGGKVLL